MLGGVSRYLYVRHGDLYKSIAFSDRKEEYAPEILLAIAASTKTG